MTKVVYSVTRSGKSDFAKITGIGYKTDKDLIIACVGKNGKPYIRVFEDCIKECHSIPSRPNEYKGSITEYREVEFEKNGSYEIREIELEYDIRNRLQKKLLLLKYNRNPLIVVRAKLYNLLERKMINKIIEFFKKPSIRLILPIIGIVFIIVY